MRARIVAVGFVALTSFGMTTACSSSGSATKTPTTVASSAAGASTTAGGSDTTISSEGDASSVELVKEMGTGTKTILWTKDKSFDPSSVTLKVGDIIEFKAAPGAGIASVGLTSDGLTITPGMSESFKFTKAGTFTFHEQVTNATATVKVTK